MKASGSAGRPTLDVWEIVQYFYCPRKIYYLRTLGIPFRPRRKMEEGKTQHEQELKRMQERKTLFGFPPEEVSEVYRKLYVEDTKMGLFGQVDTAIRLRDGRLLPVEVKYTAYPEATRSRRKQLIAYSMLLEKRFGQPVNEGILYFPEQNRQLTVSIDASDKKALERDLEKIRELIRTERIPLRVRIEHCSYCEFYKYCWS